MALAADEREIMERLKKAYRQAARDCREKIRELSMRADMENLQSIIYQRQYQELLKKQIDRTLDDLCSGEFTAISEYIAHCYETGFLGVLYDLQGQGVPLMFPMNVDEAARAVQVDSRLSEPMYGRLGEDTRKLKKSIRAELSRGIANGSSWNKIAACISTGMNSPFRAAYNNSVRIARTEGPGCKTKRRSNASNRRRPGGRTSSRYGTPRWTGRQGRITLSWTGRQRKLMNLLKWRGKKPCTRVVLGMRRKTATAAAS